MSAWTQASPPSGPNFLATFPVIPSSHMPWGEGTIPLPGKTKHIRASWLLSLLLLSWWPFFLSPHLATFLSISHANYLFLYYGIWHILTSKVPLLLKSSINISGTAYCLQLVYIHSRFSFIPFDLSQSYTILYSTFTKRYAVLRKLLGNFRYCCLPIHTAEDSQESI